MAKWTKVGGGCFLIGDDPYPCDDSYENKKGERVVVHSTKDKTFEMPESTNTLTALFGLHGVRPNRRRGD